MAAYHSDAGVADATIVAIIAAGVALTVGQIAIATVRSPLIRGAIGLLYAVPTVIGVYNGALGFAQMGIRSPGWRMTFAVIGAVTVGGTAWARMALFAPPGPRGAAFRFHDFHEPHIPWQLTNLTVLPLAPTPIGG